MSDERNGRRPTEEELCTRLVDMENAARDYIAACNLRIAQLEGELQAASARIVELENALAEPRRDEDLAIDPKLKDAFREQFLHTAPTEYSGVNWADGVPITERPVDERDRIEWRLSLLEFAKRQGLMLELHEASNQHENLVGRTWRAFFAGVTVEGAVAGAMCTRLDEHGVTSDADGYGATKEQAVLALMSALSGERLVIERDGKRRAFYAPGDLYWDYDAAVL